MSFKTRPGFTLIEVIIATAIMGIMFASIFALQSRMTNSVVWATQQFERMFHARNFLIEAAESDDDADKAEKEVVTRTKKITRPPTELLYKKSKLTSDEPFGEYADDLYKQQVTITWNEGQRKRQQTLVGFVYQPKKAKKEEKEAEKKASAPEQKEKPKTDQPPKSPVIKTPGNTPPAPPVPNVPVQGEGSNDQLGAPT